MLSSSSSSPSSSPQSPPIPYPLGAKLFLENLLLGFVESAAVLLPSAITTTATSSSPATNNNNNNNTDDSTPEYYENLLRSILSTVFQQGFEHQQQQYTNLIGSSSSSSARNHKQKTSLIIADHDVVRDVTLPAAKLAAYPVNEARLVPSVLIPSVETLRHVLRQRLSDLGITGIASDGTSAPPPSTSTITTNNSNNNNINNNSFVTTDAIITIARSLSCAAFFLDRNHDDNDSEDESKRIHRFKTLTTVMDEIFVEEDFSKKGNFDAKRLGRVFDFFWHETLSSVSPASSSSSSSSTSTSTNQNCLLNSIIDKSTPWRLALQLFVEDSSASSFFAPHSFERYLNSELTMLQNIVSTQANSDQEKQKDQNETNNNNNWIEMGKKLGLSNSTLATIRAVFLVLIFGSTDAKFFAASLKLLAKNNSSNSSLLSPSSARIGKQDSENSSVINNQKSAGQRLVRFAIDRIFVRDEGEGSQSTPPNLSQVILSLLIQFSKQHEPTVQNNYLVHSLIERSDEHKDKIEQLLFNNHHHQNIKKASSSLSLSQKLFTSSAAIFSAEVFKDLCLAVSTNINNDVDGQPVSSNELPAANTLPALIADAFVEEINQSSNHEDCVKTMRRIANLFNEGNYDEDVAAKNENSNGKSSLRPIALVFASRVYLSPDGCIEFFRNTTSIMTQGLICAENHMSLLSSIISSLEGFMQDFDKNDDDQENVSNKNIETKFLVMSVLRHLKVTWELAKAFDEVNAEALDMTNNNNSFSQLAMTNMSGFYGSSAFKRIMKPIVSPGSTNNNNSDGKNGNSSLLSSHGSSWLLCYLLTSRNNMMNLLDNYSCDLVYRAITVASSQLGLLSSSSHFWQNQQQTILNDQYNHKNKNNNNNNNESSQTKQDNEFFFYEGLLQLVDLSRALSGERVVVSCAVSLQRLSKVSVLIDVSSSIMTEVSQSLELLQQQKSASNNYNNNNQQQQQQLYHNNLNSLPTYITCQDLVDAIVTTVVSLLLQPFFSESIITDNETILARRCTAFKNIWSQIQAQVKRSGFELSGGVVRAAQQALGRVSLVSKLPTGPLRRSVMISDTAELLLRAAESGAEEVVKALLSTLCAKDQEDDSNEKNKNNNNDQQILLDSTIEEAFATWHLQRDLTPTSLFGNATSNSNENPPLLLASEFLGAGDVVLSILRRASSTTNFSSSSSASLGSTTASEKFSSSLVSSTNNHSSSSSSSTLITEDVISSLLHQLVQKSKIQSLQNIVAVALDMNKAKKTKNEMIMNPMTGSPSSAASSSSSQITFKEMYRRICDPFLRHDLVDLTPALETQYEAVSILSPQRSRVTSFRQLGEILAPMLDSGMLTRYVWKGYFDHKNNNVGTDQDELESSASSSPLSCLIEHIVSCVGSIEKLSGGEQILNEENVVFSTTEESLEDLVKKLHAAFIKAVISSKSSTTTSICCWASTNSSSQESQQQQQQPQKRCLSPFSILLLLLQHLDSVLKENVEEFFATNNSKAKSQTITSTSRQKDDVSPLFQLGAKCIDELAKAAPSSNIEPLAVGLLRRIGALSSATATVAVTAAATLTSGDGIQSSSSSSSSLLHQVKNHFCNNVLYNSSPIIQSQIILIERRIQVQQKFFACTKECEIFGLLCVDDENKKKEDPKYRNTFTTETTEKIKTKMSSFSPEESISVLSPVTSILFMLMPGVAQNEIAPSWLKILTRQILDLFEIKTSKHHQSILSLCDTMVPFADLIQWCPSAFFASARSLEAFDSSNSSNTHLSGGGSNINSNSSSASTRSGDVLRLHCCLALCLASLSKNLPTKNNNEGNEEDIKSEYIKLAHAFLKQLTFPDYFVEIAIPGKSSLGIIHHNNHFTSKDTNNNNANTASADESATTRTTYLLERVLKACGRAVHVAFPVELLLTLYKDVISMNPSLLNFAQQAVNRTKRFGTLRSTIQKCVDETMKEDQLSQQVRELDFSAFPPSLLATLRRQLLRQRQFDTLVALFEEVIQAEPEKQTLETATEGLCITHSQKIVFAFLYCKMVNKKNAKLNDTNAQQQDPGFAALQTFSSLHRNLYQNCSGEMELQKGSFLSGNMIQTRVVSLVLQGCQDAAAKHEKNINSNQNLNSRSSKNSSSDDELFSPFPDEIFDLVDQPDWFNIAFRLLTFVTESSSLRKYFVADPKWKRSLLGIATMRALLSVKLPPSSVIAAADTKNNNNNNSNDDQQQEKPLSSLFAASIFMKEPMLVIENLIMCCHTNEAAEVLKFVPTLNCDELVMDYALRAVSVQGLTELDDDLFPFGCRVSGVEANEEGVLFPLDTQLTLRLKPDQSAMVRERTRENFKYSRNPLVFLHCAIATLCRDAAFRFKRCFDFAVALYDQVAASCDRPPFQDLLVDLGARVLASATDAAVNAGVFQDDASLAHDASLLAALFHVARVMLLAGEEKFHTFDRFQDPSTRAMAVKDLVFDLLDAGLTSAASHIALSTAGLVKGLDAIWLADATRLASLGLIDEASAAISRLDGSQGARSDTAQILIPLIEHSASAGLIGCYGAVKRDVFLSGGKNTNNNNNNNSTNNNLNKIKNANSNSSSSSALLSASAAASLANIPVQQKYLLARPESLEICDRNKVIRESVVGSLVKEFTGIPGTIKFMVRQNKIQETVRVALTGSISSNVVASPKTVVISAIAFANSVFYDNGLLMRPEIHGQLRQSMKRVDPTLVLCRPFIEAVVDKLATVAPPKEASPNGPTPTTILLQFQLDWMTWSHDHSAAGRIAIALAAESPDYVTCLKFVDVAEEHSTLSKLQPTYVEPVTNRNNGNDDDDDVAAGAGGSNQRNNNRKNNIMTEEEEEDQEREENERKKAQQDEEQRDPDAFAADGTKYPPCKMDVMQRLDLLGRLRFQRALIKLLADCGPKLQLGWYDVVQEENLLESVKRLVASQYRNSGILDVCVKALTSISHPTAPLFTTALRNVKETNRNDMALAFATLLVGSPALSANDRDATLLECIRYLGPTVITDSPSAAQQKIIKEVDAAVDAISSDNYSYRCGALLACGRLQDAYRTAAVEAQSVQLVQEVASKCQTAPLNKLKQSKQVVEMCMQYVSFARGR